MAGNDVEMQMEHCLPGGRFVELGDEDAVRIEDVFECLATF